MGIGILPTNDPNATDKQAKHPPHITAPSQPLQHSFSRHIRVSLNLSQKGTEPYARWLLPMDIGVIPA